MDRVLKIMELNKLSQIEKNTERKFCGFCGAENSPEFKFCSKCGKKL